MEFCTVVRAAVFILGMADLGLLQVKQGLAHIRESISSLLR